MIGKLFHRPVLRVVDLSFPVHHPLPPVENVGNNQLSPCLWQFVLVESLSMGIPNVLPVVSQSLRHSEREGSLVCERPINSIVHYIEQLQELDTKDVEPLAHGIEVRNVFRDDVRGPSLPREAALANAPKSNDESFLVPTVLE